MKGIIAVDIGTSSLRALLYDANACVVCMDQRENMPSSFSDGRVEQDPAAWQSVLPAVLKTCGQVAVAKGIEIIGVTVTAQRSSVIPVDVRGVPLHPAIMWQDRRTAELAQEMEAHNRLVYGRTGLKISPVFSAIKMTWLRRNRPDIWSKTYKLIGIQDWAIYLLTGRFATDHTFASRTNLFDLKQRRWDPELLKLFDVEPSMLCDLVEPGCIVGGLIPPMAKEAGLTPGLPVVSAGGDQQCAALGLGLFSGERAVSNTGTGSYLIGHADNPVFDPGMRLACNVSAVPGAYMVEAAVLTSGIVYRWFKEALFRSNPDTGDSFDAINAEAEAAPPGANGLLLLPHFKGRGAPYWDPEAQGVFFNLTLTTSRGEMARAILEGIAIEMQESLELVESLCGTVHAVSVSGGMTKSHLFNQIQSDVFERTIVRYGNNEATSFGAWIAAAVALGLETNHRGAFTRAENAESARTYQPSPVTREIYRRRCRESRALYQTLSNPLFRETIQ
jgi:glycerol kinase